MTSKRHESSPYWNYVNKREHNCSIDVTDMKLPFCDKSVTEMLQEERREENKQFLKACTKNLGLLSAKQKQIWELLRKGLTPMEISVKLCMHRRQLYREFSYIKRRMMSILGEGAKP